MRSVYHQSTKVTPRCVYLKVSEALSVYLVSLVCFRPINPSILKFVCAAKLTNPANAVHLSYEGMHTYLIETPQPLLAAAAQFVVCSAVIKEIKIQTSVTKTCGSGFSTEINTQPYQSSQTHVKNPDSHVYRSPDSLPALARGNSGNTFRFQ